jgi:predicted dehydrogenase
MRQVSTFAAIQTDDIGSDPRLTEAAACFEAGPVPASIAIAGIYGYIGQLIYRAAVDAGVPKIFGFDPGPKPAGFRYSGRLTMLRLEEAFYELDADLFHIATHPDRRQGVYRLLERGRHVTIEKPMAHPAHPAECQRLSEAARHSEATVLFDFVELFNPHSFQIRDMLRQLAGYRDYRITQVRCERSKDREDPLNPRNRKVIVPIQYQETAHCLAMLLFVTDRCASFAEAFPEGMTVAATSAPYDPPNPEDYRYGVVDGKVTGEISVGDMTVSICTDFKRRGGVPFKCFSIEGVASRRAFRIESIFDGTREQVLFDGKVVASAGPGTRHQDIIRQAWRWHRERSTCPRPDADFASLVFGLSAALWASCHQGREVRIDTEAELQDTMERYPESVARRARYPGTGGTNRLNTAALSRPPHSAARASCSSDRCSCDSGTRAPLCAARSRISPTSLACCASRAEGRVKSRESMISPWVSMTSE